MKEYVLGLFTILLLFIVSFAIANVNASKTSVTNTVFVSAIHKKSFGEQQTPSHTFDNPIITKLTAISLRSTELPLYTNTIVNGNGTSNVMVIIGLSNLCEGVCFSLNDSSWIADTKCVLNLAADCCCPNQPISRPVSSGSHKRSGRGARFNRGGGWQRHQSKFCRPCKYAMNTRLID